MYLVFKKGVYRHECVAASESLAEAREQAQYAADHDDDDAYHEFIVYEVKPSSVKFKDCTGKISDTSSMAWYVDCLTKLESWKKEQLKVSNG